MSRLTTTFHMEHDLSAFTTPFHNHGLFSRCEAGFGNGTAFTASVYVSLFQPQAAR